MNENLLLLALDSKSIQINWNMYILLWVKHNADGENKAGVGWARRKRLKRNEEILYKYFHVILESNRHKYKLKVHLVSLKYFFLCVCAVHRQK